MTSHEPDDAHVIDALVDEQVRRVLLDEGSPINNVKAFRAHWRREIAEQVRDVPGFLDAARRRLAGGPRVTRCREVRGTHGIDHVWDPQGTDPAPPWWNEGEARAIAQRRAETPTFLEAAAAARESGELDDYDPELLPRTTRRVYARHDLVSDSKGERLGQLVLVDVPSDQDAIRHPT